MSKKVLLFCACMVFAGYANASSEADKERENTVENEILLMMLTSRQALSPI